MDNETKLTKLIARYPNRWRQAVTNPALRGWFVNKMTGRGAPMAAASYAIDCRARQEAPLVIVLLERKPLRSIAYPLKLFDELVIGLDRLFNRNIIRRCEANRLQKLASDIGHCLCVGEIGWGVLWGLVHVAKYLGDAQLTCGHSIRHFEAFCHL